MELPARSGEIHLEGGSKCGGISMKTMLLLSTTRRVLGFQMRNELLSFWLKPHTIRSRLVAELDGVSDMDKLLAPMILRRERSASLLHGILYGISMLSAECGIRLQRGALP